MRMPCCPWSTVEALRFATMTLWSSSSPRRTLLQLLSFSFFCPCAQSMIFFGKEVQLLSQAASGEGRSQTKKDAAWPQHTAITNVMLLVSRFTNFRIFDFPMPDRLAQVERGTALSVVILWMTQLPVCQCQVEEPFLVSYFRRIFQRISSHDEGVTKKQLHEAGAEAKINSWLFIWTEFHGISWCFIIFHIVSWYPGAFQDPSWQAAPSPNSVAWNSPSPDITSVVSGVGELWDESSRGDSWNSWCCCHSAMPEMERLERWR